MGTGSTLDAFHPDCYVLGLQDVGEAQLAVVGGKGALLGALSRIDGIHVPAGFCVTTSAFGRIMAHAPSLDDRLDLLSGVSPDDREPIRALAADVRRIVERIAIPDDLAAEIGGALAELDKLGKDGNDGDHGAYAVRSSATAEDSPTASFAGQHDTYLNVVGPAAVLQHVSRCWSSLFTERAVAYRVRHGIDQRTVQMAVVVQRMVVADAAGVLFTADPVTSNRNVVSVEATFGLGEALVSGRVNADVYRVRDEEIVAKAVTTKRVAVHASPAGGTLERAIEPEQQARAALTDQQVLQLAQLGRRIEARFGRPQDVEWCLADGDFQIVQTRPITTLFPIPDVDDGDRHVYVSVGHQQMMTDAMTPLALSLWQLTALRPMYVAGGRLFVDVTRELASPARRAALLEGLGRSDPLIGDALRTIVERDDFVPPLPDEGPAGPPAGGAPADLETDPAIVADLIGRSQASIDALKRDIQASSGSALLDFIVEDIQELRRMLSEPRSHQVVMAGIEAAWWLNEHLLAWLGEKNAADTLAQSVPDNVTSEMGLALLTVADAIRPHPDVVAFLEQVDHEGFVDELAKVSGGRHARDAIRAYLDRYGMRCVGEIDIARPRWSERPTTLLPAILANVRNFEAGAAERRFEQGRHEASVKEQDLLARVRALPDGERKADETKRMIDRLRTFAGYREHPKYAMISRYFVYKQALLDEAGRLAHAGVLRAADDVFFLTFHELHDVVRTGHVDDQLVRQRKDAFRSYQALTPPRVLTSEGEVVTGTYRRDDVPTGALAGVPVSAGTVEGRARVVLDMAAADLDVGDVLVTTHTDPSWSPVFVTIAGLVTEVGGLTTHGAVIAREYGVPAVVSVEQATRLIRDGQRIRVNGTDGYVEVLTGR